MRFWDRVSQLVTSQILTAAFACHQACNSFHILQLLTSISTDSVPNSVPVLSYKDLRSVPRMFHALCLRELETKHFSLGGSKEESGRVKGRKWEDEKKEMGG